MRPGVPFAWFCTLIILGGFVGMVIIKLRTGTSPASLIIGGLLLLLSIRGFREQFRLFERLPPYDPG